MLQVFLAAIATMGFCGIFNVPIKELPFCGITGGLGWLVFILIDGLAITESTVFATLLAAMAVTALSRSLSFLRKEPATLYIIPGIIPLVPGAAIYFTMFYLVMGNNEYATVQGIETLTTAGTISLGLLIVLSLPLKIFKFGKDKH